MDPHFDTFVQIIEDEIEHSLNVADMFVRILCLLESHYQHRPSSLLEIYPELAGETVSDEEVERMKKTLVRFIELLPSHASVTAGIKILSLSRDRKLKGFFVAQLRLHLTWKNPVVVFMLLLAIEDLGEKVFYTRDGDFIGSRSADDTDTNFDVAKRYLESHAHLA